MPKAKVMTVGEIEQIVEQKMLEIIGDPDSGLHLKKKFKTQLEQRLNKPATRISHQEVLKKFA
jgi:hypothetical protein